MSISAAQAAFTEAAKVEAERAAAHWRAREALVGEEHWSKQQQREAEPDDWTHTEGRDDITAAELQLAKRCHGFHIETLRADTTPTASHYQLIHYDIPLLCRETHAVNVTGLVERDLSLTCADVMAMPDQLSEPVTMCCAGTGRMSQKNRLWTHVPWGPDAIGCAMWTGVPLASVLREAGLLEDAKQVVFTGADRGLEGGKVQLFQRSLSLEDAMRGHVLLVHSMNGEALPPAHGAPLRLVVPGWYGMASVKWLTSIEVTAGGWWGHQMNAYSYKRTADDEQALPLQQLGCRALMAPPGYPDFFSRARLVPPGTVRIEGKAWAGAVDIARVEFSSDGGASWQSATLLPKSGVFGWSSWFVEWRPAEEGETYVLSCRAFDAQGRAQEAPSDDAFNWGSYALTQPQKVYVKVEAAAGELGAAIDCEREVKAAKEALRGEAGLSPSLVDALYREPGSQ